MKPGVYRKVYSTYRKVYWRDMTQKENPEYIWGGFFFNMTEMKSSVRKMERYIDVTYPERKALSTDRKVCCR